MPVGPQEYQDRAHSAAIYPHPAGYFQVSDPFTEGKPVHAGTFWIDRSGGVAPWPMKIRNADNTAWEDMGGSGSSVGHVIMVNGVVMPQRSILEFRGGNIIASDDETHDKTILTFIAEGGEFSLTLGGELLTLGGESIVLGG